LLEGAVLTAATAVGTDAIEGVTALSATAPAKPRAIPVLRYNITRSSFVNFAGGPVKTVEKHLIR
jgi:hypothetical protein